MNTISLMTSEIGHFALILALCVAMVQATVPVFGAARNISGWPVQSSRHLYAGHRLVSSQVASRLVPGHTQNPCFDDGFDHFDTSAVVHLRSSSPNSSDISNNPFSLVAHHPSSLPEQL